MTEQIAVFWMGMVFGELAVGFVWALVPLYHKWQHKRQMKKWRREDEERARREHERFMAVWRHSPFKEQGEAYIREMLEEMKQGTWQEAHEDPETAEIIAEFQKAQEKA